MANYLEVDSNILEKNFLLNKNSIENEDFEKFLREAENFTTEGAPWKQSTPVPGMCIKTTDDKMNKVFINLCQLDDIPEPKSLTDDEIIELWQSEDASNYRIPLSILEPHDELDKSGKPAVTYDVAVNSNFFKKIQESMVLRSFVLQVVLEGLENKYDVTLKKEGFVILQNRKCLGTLKPHRIKLQKGPYVPPKRLIEELPSSRTNSVGTEKPKLASKEKLPDENFRIFENTRDNQLICEFYLPKVVAIKDIRLDVNEDRLVLECQRPSCFSDFFLPLKIDPNKVKARFNKTSKILAVVMPIVRAP